MAAPLGLVASGMLDERARNRQLGQTDRQIGLQERRLGLTEQQMQAESQAQQRAAVAKNVGDLLSLADQTAQAVIQRAEDQGLDRDAIIGQAEQQIAPLIQRAAVLAQASGDPTLAMQVQGAATRLQAYRSRADVVNEKATEAGVVAGAQAAARAPFTKAPVTNITTNVMGEVETAGQKELAKLSANRVAEIRAAAGNADKNLTQIRRARQLLERTNTGQLAGVTLGIKRFMKAVGMDPEALGITDDTGAAEALQSLGTDFALQRVQETKGSVSDMEMRLYAEAAAGLSRTREGNLLILELGEKLAMRAQDAAREVNKYLNEGGSITGVDMVIQDYYDRNPLMTTDEVQNRVNQALAQPVANALPGGGPVVRPAQEIATAADIQRTAKDTGQTPAAVARALRKRGIPMTREAAAIEVAE